MFIVMFYKMAKIRTNSNVHSKKNGQFHCHDMDESPIHDVNKTGQTRKKQKIPSIWNSKQHSPDVIEGKIVANLVNVENSRRTKKLSS